MKKRGKYYVLCVMWVCVVLIIALTIRQITSNRIDLYIFRERTSYPLRKYIDICAWDGVCMRATRIHIHTHIKHTLLTFFFQADLQI